MRLTDDQIIKAISRCLIQYEGRPVVISVYDNGCFKEQVDTFAPPGVNVVPPSYGRVMGVIQPLCTGRSDWRVVGHNEAFGRITIDAAQVKK